MYFNQIGNSLTLGSIRRPPLPSRHSGSCSLLLWTGWGLMPGLCWMAAGAASVPTTPWETSMPPLPWRLQGRHRHHSPPKPSNQILQDIVLVFGLVLQLVWLFLPASSAADGGPSLLSELVFGTALWTYDPCTQCCNTHDPYSSLPCSTAHWRSCFHPSLQWSHKPHMSSVSHHTAVMEQIAVVMWL